MRSAPRAPLWRVAQLGPAAARAGACAAGCRQRRVGRSPQMSMESGTQLLRRSIQRLLVRTAGRCTYLKVKVPDSREGRAGWQGEAGAVHREHGHLRREGLRHPRAAHEALPAGAPRAAPGGAGRVSLRSRACARCGTLHGLSTAQRPAEPMQPSSK